MSVKKRKLNTATVQEVEALSPRVRRIRLSGPKMVGMSWTPGDKVKVEANGKLTSYTPGRISDTEGWMDIIFHLHGNGRASQWAEAVEVGAQVKYLGPVKSVKPAKGTPDWALFIGDETTIGLAAALLEALPDTVHTFGAIEVAEEDVPSVAGFSVPLDAVTRDGLHGDALVSWLETQNLPTGKGMIWLSGEALSVRALKRKLTTRIDPDLVTLKTKAYWSAKGHAHRKALERADFAAK